MLSPAMVGFRCKDRDLSMPYVETGDELIPLLMLLSLAFAGPAASVSASRTHTHTHTHTFGHWRGRKLIQCVINTSVFPCWPGNEMSVSLHVV